MSLYLPHAFVGSLEVGQEIIRSNPLATLISAVGDEIAVSHIPVVLVAEGDSVESWIFSFHLSRANPHVHSLLASCKVKMIFQGAESYYISPNIYPSKHTNDGKVVPTWNFAAVHVEGVPQPIDSSHEDRMKVVTALTDHFEGLSQKNPWKVTDAPEAYLRVMSKQIVCFTMKPTKVDVKVKMSQNKPSLDAAAAFQACPALQRFVEDSNPPGDAS